VKTEIGKRWLSVAAVVLCLTAGALANSVNMTMTGAGSTVLGGVYVGPYTATVNGVSTTIVCNDFLDDSFIGESWQANQNSFSTLSSAEWASSFPSTYVSLYEQAAWLTLQMLNTKNASQLGDLQYAVWAVFDPAALNSLSGTDLANAKAWLSDAAGQTFTINQFSNLVIYTSIPGSAKCPGFTCPPNSPQEFFAFAMPEGGSPAAYVLLVGLVSFSGTYYRFAKKRFSES
jgi:hypothetical protein